MADQKITELPIKNVSAIQLADYLLGIDSAEGYQMLISDLAKKIIEAYSGSSLGGAAQTLKSAIDTVTTNAGNNLATIEHSTTASKAYAVGDYLVLNGILYKVTTAIASGGTITVDTNVTVAAAGDDIAAIAAKIGNTSMGTTANTITGAIAEHEADISGLNSKSSRINTASNTVNGLTVNLYYLESAPNIMLLKITGTTTSEMVVASGYANLWNANTFITAACGTRSAAIIKYIQSARHNIQLHIEAGGLIKIGYVRSHADDTAVNIPAGTSFYIEELLFFK